MLCTVGCYNAAQSDMMFHTKLQWLKKTINQIMILKKLLQNVGLKVSYCVSIVRIWETIYCIIVHYTLLYQSTGGINTLCILLSYSNSMLKMLCLSMLFDKMVIDY